MTDDRGTPRTDSCEGSDGTIPICFELTEMCRQLERELAEAHKKADDNDTDKLRAIGLYDSCKAELAEARAVDQFVIHWAYGKLLTFGAQNGSAESAQMMDRLNQCIIDIAALTGATDGRVES